MVNVIPLLNCQALLSVYRKKTGAEVQNTDASVGKSELIHSNIQFATLLGNRVNYYYKSEKYGILIFPQPFETENI